MNERYPCPCCGYIVYDEPPDSYAFCTICCWEDEVSALRFPLQGGGANSPSLFDAQRNYQLFGASDRRRRSRARPPQTTDQRDPNWRLLILALDNVERTVVGVDYGMSYPRPFTQLYYWRDTYYRRRPATDEPEAPQ